MVKRSLFLVSIVIFAIIFSSCATLISGTKQRVSVKTEPSGSKVFVDGKDQNVITPCEIKIKRKKQAYLTFQKDGFENGQKIIDGQFNPVVLGNILLGGVIGAIVDYSSGAWFKYVNEILFTFPPSDPTNVNSEENKIAKRDNLGGNILEKTFTTKTTDTKNNTGTYTFYTNQQEVVNDYPINEKRIALVIGNSNYEGGHFLKNPANDANLISMTLQNLGFEVIKRIDANKQTMEQAIRDFSKKLPSYNVALFYYAGHGVQVDGLNYLIPTGAKLIDKSDCKFEAISVNYVVEEFEKYPDNVNIVILDACRNDPFRSWARGGERGFKAIAPTSGTIISFATSEGATASDGKGDNGLFTEQLVKQMYVPQPIESVFKKTRVEVERISNGTQSPQEWSKLKGDFYFKR